MPTPSDYYDPGSNPPPTPGTLITNGGIPGVTANRARGTATPLARQLVAAGVNPPNAATTDPGAAPGTVPPPAPPDEYIQLPDQAGSLVRRPAPPTPGDYKPGGYTPVPWKPAPPVGPAPPPGNWDHENEQPGWLRPKPLVGRPPNRDPDGYLNGRPIWNARPGEPGYGEVGSNALSGVVAKLESDYGRANAAQPASMVNKTYGQYPGFVATYGSGPQGVTNYAKALLQYNPNATLGDFYAGYAQGTGNPAHPPTLADMQAHYPAYYNNLIKNSPYPINTPLASLIGGTVAGPVQQYIPPQPRDASEWGRTPEHDWTPGRMPTQHDIPSIMGGMLPLVLTLFAGAAMGGGLGMIAAFSGYQNAVNKRQDQAAKDAKTQWKTHLEETASKLQEEAIGASGIVAQYGYDLSNPQALARWQELAGNFDDRQLSAALANQDGGSIERLFKNRDMAFQTLKKTSDAQNKADEQQSEKDANVGAEQSPYEGQQDNPPPAGLPGERPRPAAPGQGGWLQPPGAPATGGPAGVPAPSAPPPPQAAPGPASEAAPPSEEPAAEPSAPAPGLVRPAAWTGPPAAPAPSQSGDPVVQPGSPDALSPSQKMDLGVDGLAPWNNRGPLGQGVTGLSPARLDQDARTYLETGKPVYHGGPSGDPLAIPRNEAIARRATQMQSFIDRVIETTKPGDIDGALQRIETVDPNLASAARIVDHGDGPPPSGWQRGVPFYRNTMRIVNALDPSWDATRWVTNYRTKVAFSSGSQSTQIASMNRALQHMKVLMDTAKQLDNSDYQSWNAIANAVQKQLGSPAATEFTEARSAVARELERAFRGGSGAYAEIKADLDNVGSNASKEQILGYIRISGELLKGQLDAMADLYSRGTRKQVTGDDLLSPEARQTYNMIMKIPLSGEIPSNLGIAKVAGEAPDAELDQTATPPPQSAYGPGPAPLDIPQGWVEQPQQ